MGMERPLQNKNWRQMMQIFCNGSIKFDLCNLTILFVGLNIEVATPIDYFNLFISVYFWTRFAQYTNAKARSIEVEQDGHVRAWYNTCGAEMKAWVASVIYYCVCKTLTFEQFYNCTVDPSRCKKWFPSWRRWTAIKCFFKVSDPEI